MYFYPVLTVIITSEFCIFMLIIICIFDEYLVYKIKIPTVKLYRKKKVKKNVLILKITNKECVLHRVISNNLQFNLPMNNLNCFICRIYFHKKLFK